ncbi:MAG: RNA polymerase sigma-70 factor (ECF subfamily) [Myxococcota bacterium]|jgi:RNA polymerase sigma-70 factor (ECF subfamily)
MNTEDPDTGRVVAFPGGSAGSPRTVNIGELFDQHAAYLVRVCIRLTGSRAAAEDIVQEVFITAHRRQGDLLPDSNLRTWLYRVAVNLIRHHHRSSGRYGRFVDRYKVHESRVERPAPDVDIERMQRAQQVHACVQELSDKQREVFVLYELEGMAGQDISEVLGIKLNTVWSRLRLARKAFREQWATQHGPEERQ